MRIDYIRQVIAVSKWKSINKAAAHLYTNHQQLSRVIDAVENDLNTKIFHRTTKGITVTPEGEKVIPKFEQIVALYDSLSQISEKPNTLKGRLDIFSEVNVWTSYARFYKDFAKAYPELQCFIRNMASPEIIQTLHQQDGIGLISRMDGDGIQSLDIPKSLEFYPISRTHLMVYGSPDSPYVKKYKTISMATLCKLPLINFKPYSNYPSIMEQAFQGIGKANIQYVVSDIKVFHEIAAETDCLFLAIKKPKYVAADTLQEIPLRDNIFLEHGVLKRKQTAKSCEAFLNYYQEYYKGLYA